MMRFSLLVLLFFLCFLEHQSCCLFQLLLLLQHHIVKAHMHVFGLLRLPWAVSKLQELLLFVSSHDDLSLVQSCVEGILAEGNLLMRPSFRGTFHELLVVCLLELFDDELLVVRELCLHAMQQFTLASLWRGCASCCCFLWQWCILNALRLLLFVVHNKSTWVSLIMSALKKDVEVVSAARVMF